MLRKMGNDDLFKLYNSDLLLRLHNVKNLSDTRKTLARFKEYLGEYPYSPELANLEVKDIHDNFLVVREGKNDKDRVIPLSQPIALRLKNFNEGKSPSDKVFGLKPASITNKINVFAKKAGLNKFHAHMLRHKFATDLLEHGVDTGQYSIYLDMRTYQLRKFIYRLPIKGFVKLSICLINL